LRLTSIAWGEEVGDDVLSTTFVEEVQRASAGAWKPSGRVIAYDMMVEMECQVAVKRKKLELLSIF